MIKITNITMRNFLSVGNVTQAIRLDQNGLTLVLGENIDTAGGPAGNGAGKSTILQAISYALFNKPLTKIRLPNLVNNINNKGMLVTLEFERDGKTYRIERGQKPAVVKFFENGNEIEGEGEKDTAQGDSRHTKTDIETLIGMSHTMFKHIVALNTFTEPFLKMTVSDQRAVIEELLGVTQISERAETLKKVINNTKDAIREHEATVRATTEANARIETMIKQTQSNATAWQRSHDTTLANLASDIEELTHIDFDAELRQFDAYDHFVVQERALLTELADVEREATSQRRDIAALAGTLSSLNKDLSKVDAEDAQITARTRGDIKRRQAEAGRHETQMSKFAAELATVEGDLQNADSQVCVCCNQKLVGTDHLEVVMTNLRERAADLTTKMEREGREHEDCMREVVNLERELEVSLLGSVAARETIKTKIVETEQKLTMEQDDLSKAEVAVASAKAALGALERPALAFKSRDEVYRLKQSRDMLERDLEQEMSKTNPYVEQVTNLQATIQKIDFEPLNELTVLMKHQEFLLRILTNKDSFIRKRIIDQNLAYLNARVAHYLEKLYLPHEVKFMSDLSVEITLLGREFDFEQLSRGEMNRVIMATSWSFRDVWESMNTSLNMLWVDEMLDQGTDTQGVEAAIGLLKGMARERKKNVFLISHREELIGRIDTVLKVRKSDGFTQFDIEVEEAEPA